MQKYLFVSVAIALACIAQLKGQEDAFTRDLGLYFRSQKAVAPPSTKYQQSDPVRRWNEIAVNATGLDHTPVPPGDPRIFGEQFGPGRSSRAMAIVHIAIFDALNAVNHRYRGYTGVEDYQRPIAPWAAVAKAAHDTLVALYPSQAGTFDARLAEDLAQIHNSRQRANGIDLGRRVAAAILALRQSDGSEVPEPQIGVDYFPSDQPGRWRQDPISLVPIALGAHWGECRPFVIESAQQFACPPPPAMTSNEYTTAYNEAKSIGGDGITTPSTRTPEQTFIGVFWAYDATPSLCAPPRLYNQVTVQIADQRRVQPLELSRLLALVNTAMADAAISAWDSKYRFDFWRPIAGIRESDPGTGPTGQGDGNPATIGDVNFTPLGAPASNLQGPNFTPPFPAYPSGHAAFGGAIFQIMRRFYGTDEIGFRFVSDEFNGTTRDNQGNVRPYMPRHFSRLSQAEEENGQSRIYLGIHWAFDKTKGISQGRRVADYVYDHVFAPLGAGER